MPSTGPHDLKDLGLFEADFDVWPESAALQPTAAMIAVLHMAGSKALVAASHAAAAAAAAACDATPSHQRKMKQLILSGKGDMPSTRARSHARLPLSGAAHTAHAHEPAVAGLRGHLSLRRARVVEGSSGSGSHAAGAAEAGAAEAGAGGLGRALTPFPPRPSRPRLASEAGVGVDVGSGGGIRGSRASACRSFSTSPSCYSYGASSDGASGALGGGERAAHSLSISQRSSAHLGAAFEDPPDTEEAPCSPRRLFLGQAASSIV